MKYAKEKASPLALLEASEAMEEARKAVSNALRAINGQVKTRLLDDYIRMEEKLRGEAMRLEDDFAVLIAKKYGVPMRQVPLFGSDENMKRARCYFEALALREGL